MPIIRLVIDRKGIERFTDATFNHGDPLSIMVDGRAIKHDWVDGQNDPGLTVGQSETLDQILTDGLVIEIDEDGLIT